MRVIFSIRCERSVNNDPGYASTAFDQLLDSAAANPDPDRRRTLLERREALMLADYPIVPLYYLVSKRPVKPYLHRVVANPSNQLSQHLSLAAR